jgi:hypothetical protein
MSEWEAWVRGSGRLSHSQPLTRERQWLPYSSSMRATAVVARSIRAVSFVDYGEKSGAEAPDARSVSVGASTPLAADRLRSMPVAEPRLAQDRLSNQRS